MATEQRYRDRAKEAREKAATANDENIRRVWLDIAKGLEWLAERPGKEPVWHVERLKPKT